jgi:hypothetical protein
MRRTLVRAGAAWLSQIGRSKCSFRFLIESLNIGARFKAIKRARGGDTHTHTKRLAPKNRIDPSDAEKHWRKKNTRASSGSKSKACYTVPSQKRKKKVPLCLCVCVCVVTSIASSLCECIDPSIRRPFIFSPFAII